MSEQLKQRYPVWQALEQHRQQWNSRHLREEFARDTKRAQRFTLEAAGLFLDFSKNLIDDHTLELLSQLTKEAELGKAIKAMFAGEAINSSEQRPALHTALRNFGAHRCPQEYDVPQALAQMDQLVTKLHNRQWFGFSGKPITDVVNIGIGGSDLGPRTVAGALTPFHKTDIRLHFVTNMDATDICETLEKLNPETTLFMVASKSFTTLETLANARSARTWLLQACDQDKGAIPKHFLAITARRERAQEFGITAANIFPLWDWVGERYSLWSANGLSIAIALGMDGFNQLRRGAFDMDHHFRHSPAHRNMPVILALLEIWYQHFWGATSHCVLPYAHCLRTLPRYLQQLDMESNGKSVRKDGSRVDYQTGAILWGATGTTGQHSFHQLLLQGRHFIPVDFIAPIHNPHTLPGHQEHLLACCFSQSQALMQGKGAEEVARELSEQGYSLPEIQALISHKVIPGNSPSNTLLMESLNPAVLGALLALFEHKVFVQSVIWDIDAFDQWGVELGKELSTPIYRSLTSDEFPGTSETLDSSTLQLVQRARQGLK